MCMFNKIYLANKLKKEYEIKNNFLYDYVIRIRPDLVVKEHLPSYIFKDDYKKAFEKVDVIVGPTSPTVAFTIGEKSDDPLAMYLSDIYTVPANLAGVPSISVPCGVGAISGLPVGLQLTGNMFDEATILRAAWHVEQGLQSQL